LESWWHSAHQEWVKNSQNITVVCPHPAAVFNEETTAHAKAQIAAVHSVMLEAQRHYCQQQHPDPQTAVVARPARRVSIAEPEGDIQMLYRLYLESRGLKVTIVSSSANCLDSVFNTLDNDGFDTIILDTHLKDISGIEVARKIKQRLPDQRIIITSTTGVHADEIEPVGLIKAYNVLQKPIYFSKLLGLIKPEK
jgi:CheY-like chemotaxis protein